MPPKHLCPWLARALLPQLESARPRFQSSSSYELPRFVHSKMMCMYHKESSLHRRIRNFLLDIPISYQRQRSVELRSILVKTAGKNIPFEHCSGHSVLLKVLSVQPLLTRALSPVEKQNPFVTHTSPCRQQCETVAV